MTQNSITGSVVGQDTICALATPAGGAIGVIRVSGPKAWQTVSKVFSKNLTTAKPNTLHYGEVHDAQGRTVDDVIVSLWKAPHSYTGEDAAELSCHGSAIVLSHVLNVLIQAGCRQAQPGEYTMRAYLNGKMDLSQAEAVADIISASNEASYRIALNQMKGAVHSKLQVLRDKLLKMTSLLELELDFSDHEDLEFADRTQLKQLAHDIDAQVQELAASFKTGQALKNGIPVAIVGKTNVGKSTLLNQLLGEQRALVSDIHGTTRDAIEDTINIKGVTFRLIDTAGLRRTNDRVEQMGITKSYDKMQHASIILWVIDQQPSSEDFAKMHAAAGKAHIILVVNKQDIQSMEVKAPHGMILVPVSALRGINMDRLRETIYTEAQLPDISEHSVIVTSARHYQCLVSAHHNLTLVENALQNKLSGDLTAEFLRAVLADLAAITGEEITPQDTLNEIFSHFCIGK